MSVQEFRQNQQLCRMTLDKDGFLSFFSLTADSGTAQRRESEICFSFARKDVNVS